MKIVPLSEAKSRLSHYGRLCHAEPVVVTVNGVPAFELVPLDDNDDLINQLLEHNPSFRKLLKDRLAEKTVSSANVLKRLNSSR